MVYRLIAIVAALLLAACTPPRITIERAKLAPIQDAKYVVLGFDVQGQATTEELKGTGPRMSGEERIVLFPGQAREAISQDLKDWAASRLSPQSGGDVVISVKLNTACSYTERNKSGANWVPVVGIFVGMAENSSVIPVHFVVKMDVEIEKGGQMILAKQIDISDLHQEQGISLQERHAVIYGQQLEKVREGLFKRLDLHILPTLKRLQNNSISSELIPKG